MPLAPPDMDDARGDFGEVPLKIASLNVNGLNIPTKRRAIYEKLRGGGFDICLLQEMHSSAASAHIWRSEWGGDVIFNHGSSNSRGVMILFRRGLDPTINSSASDDEGRILLVDLTLDNAQYVVGSLYAPTSENSEAQLSFVDLLEQKLNDLCSVNIILGGDLNIALVPDKDRRRMGHQRQPSDRASGRLLALIDDFDLCDAWRARNPDQRRYSFHRARQASRIDYWLVSEHLLDCCSKVDMTSTALSDHALLSVEFGSLGHRRGPGLWRFAAVF